MSSSNIGWLAALFTVLMSFSYIDQIRLNIQNEKGSLIMFIMMVCNFSLWTLYGYKTKQKQIWITNGLGLLFSLILLITYFL